MNILTICNISDKVVCNFLTKWAGDLKIGQNTGYLAYVLMAKSNLTKTYKMNILTICNISDKVICNLLTKWVRDLKIGQNTGYLAHVLMAKSNLTKHTKWTSSQYAIFQIKWYVTS